RLVFRSIGSDDRNGYRALRLKELLDGDALQLTDVARIQMDVVSPPARQVVRLLQNMTCTSPAAERVRARLAVWDAVMVRGRVEPPLYEAFVARFAEHALRPLCGDAWRIVAGVDLTHPVFEYPG